MQHYGIDVSAERRSTLPVWDIEYESRLIYSEATDMLYCGSGTGWITISGGAGGVGISSVIEDTTPQLGGQLEVQEFDIKLEESLSVDGKYSGITCSGVLGTTLVFGDLVYLNTTNQQWVKTDPSAETTSGNVILSMVLADGINGDTRLLLLNGFIRNNSWDFNSYGQALFINNIAGDITDTVLSGSGEINRVIGYVGKNNDTVYFDPDKTWLELA